MSIYPSIDKPWLQYYKKHENEKALSTLTDQTIYRFYKDNVFVDPSFPLIKYFNTTLSTSQFIDEISLWAKAFCSVGVREDEMIPVYGTWSPEIAAIFFALNAIGAHPYFEKLDITEDALRTETSGARIAVIFEPLWNDVAKAVFCESRFTTVFMVTLADSMRSPLKQIVGLKGFQLRKSISNSTKFLFKDQVRKLADGYMGSFEVPFKKDRIALITSSSGTTSSVVKGIMDTNESALANILATSYANPGFFPKKECFITLPPTASTAINSFFLLPLLIGLTVRIDPRADEDNWTKLLLKYKPSVSLSTGAMWYSFLRNVASMEKQGKNIDLSFGDSFIMGGSGVTPKQLAFMNDTLKRCGCKHSIVSGYGCSEYFGVITVDKYEIEYTPLVNDAIEVGIPIPGAVVGVFDSEGNELPCGQRGELWVKGPAVMHGYFGKTEVTKQMFSGEWMKTGDICVIDENGYIYCYGRKRNSIEVNGNTQYLFDIANALRNQFELEDCMVEVRSLVDRTQSILVYYVQDDSKRVNRRELCMKMNTFTRKRGVIVDGYREFKEAFPISPTTLKPKNRYTDGFVNFVELGKRSSISFSPTDKDDIWTMDVMEEISSNE